MVSLLSIGYVYLKKLHAPWSGSHLDKIVGFSKSATLPPKWVCFGWPLHSVCVCKYHQYPNLMVEACLKCDAHELIKYCVFPMKVNPPLWVKTESALVVRNSLITSATVMSLVILRRSLTSSGLAQIEQSWSPCRTKGRPH